MNFGAVTVDLPTSDCSGLPFPVDWHRSTVEAAFLLFQSYAANANRARPASGVTRGVALGADGFLSKPAKAPALLAAVKTVLGG